MLRSREARWEVRRGSLRAARRDSTAVSTRSAWLHCRVEEGGGGSERQQGRGRRREGGQAGEREEAGEKQAGAGEKQGPYTMSPTEPLVKKKLRNSEQELQFFFTTVQRAL